MKANVISLENEYKKSDLEKAKSQGRFYFQRSGIVNVAGHIIVSEEKLNLVACSICVELNLLCLLSSLSNVWKRPVAEYFYSATGQ